MLKIQHIRKEYRTGNLVQKALDDVSLNLRDNEFVAILGPSGSGKTTLLNIIGGLDRYDSGDLIINGISTKKYKDKDWDSYRNHTIGFVFQSYNLIPHQSVLSNVELALTISGVGPAERKERARKALEQVGLGEQLHKKPSQMSGGQMQRVAIARALVNDPDILLADEPTGALDSETSIQVMELLQEVAKDRLVVMVTHNPELADEYATRIVKLKDGQIRADSDPFEPETEPEEPRHENMGKASMSFLTALSLSFNNLKTKKARTILTAFAGSIGIIGIALILSLSNGVNDYIQSVEEETLSEYPLQILSTGLDLSSMVEDGSGGADSSGQTEEKAGDIEVIDVLTNMFSTMDTNDLQSLKTYLDSGESNIDQYVNAIEYSYNTTPQIYRQDGEDIRQVNPDQSFASLGLGSSSASNSMMSSMMSTDVFYEMPEDTDLYEPQYEVKAGRWPERYDECVLVLTSGGGISDFMLYSMGLRDTMELDEMIRQFANEEDVEIPSDMGSYTYEDILGVTFKLVNSSDYYEYDSQYKVWRDKTDNEEYMKNLVDKGEDLKIVGVVQPAEDAKGTLLMTGIGYMPDLTKHVAQKAEDSEIVKNQLSNKNINVFTNEPFGEESGEDQFDMDSLVSVNADVLQDAFAFNEDAFSEGLQGAFDLSEMPAGSSLDLSNMIDLKNIKLDMPDAPQLGLDELMGSIKLDMSAEELGQIVTGLLSGYQEYAASHPEADYSTLGEDFLAYLNTSEAQEILIRNIQDIIQTNGNITAVPDQIRSMFQEILQGYQSYAEAQGYTDPDKFDEYLLEYLGTSEAQSILSKWGSEIFKISGDISITSDQIAKLAEELGNGYQTYAAANGLADPSKMGEHFMAYLGTDGAQNQLTEAMLSMVDADRLEQQISGSLEAYMQQAMASYGGTVAQSLQTQIGSAMEQIMAQISTGMTDAMSQAAARIGTNIQNALTIDADVFANAFTMNMSGQEFAELMMSMSSAESASYEGNLRDLGYVDFNVPSQIDIYPKDFESKEGVVKILDHYNADMEKEGKEEQVITYTDMVGALMSSVTDIIDIISYVLIAFVAISLVVSSIMIGVITYISVLERRKEIGILRAIGASKGNISQVFNAETFIIGLCAGVLGIVITLLLLIPGNALIHYLAGTTDVSAVLPVGAAFILITLSVVLTLLGGLIPSKKAAKSDPVAALRAE